MLRQIGFRKEGRVGPPGGEGAKAGRDRIGHGDAGVAEKIKALAIVGREADEIATRWPKVLRRVGGYNIDLCCPQSARPYTADGSVNYAHLLVGSEGTCAVVSAATLRLVRPPAVRGLLVLAFAPILFLIYWLWRVRVRGRISDMILGNTQSH